MDQENVRDLKKNGLLVWLRVEPGIIRERMIKDQKMGHARPALTGTGPLEEIEEVWQSRTPLYQKAMDLMVDTSRLSIPELAGILLKALLPTTLENASSP
jgi:shikimate kinase